MYGDTHVEPAPLFDPERGGRPPDDAWDVYFHAPISLSLLGDAYATHGMHRELDQLLGLYAGLAAATVTCRDRRDYASGRVTEVSLDDAEAFCAELIARLDAEIGPSLSGPR